MAINRKIKVPLACAYSIIIFLLLMTSIVTFVGTFVMKYEISRVFGNYFEDYLKIPIVILIAGSILVFADACLGFISLACRWYRGVITFLVWTTCLLISMIALVALAYFHFNSKEEAIYCRVEEALKSNTTNMDVVDTMQFGLKCCGWNNFTDWSNEVDKIIPQSCCIDNRPCDINNSWEIYSIGCYQAMSLFLYYRKWIVIVILAVLGLVEIVAITLSVTVCKNFPRKTTSESSVTNNPPLPRIHNPLAHNSLPSADNNRIYVRRPTQLPAVLNYRSPHESFLKQPPQLRFDRRVSLPSSKLKNPHAARSK